VEFLNAPVAIGKEVIMNSFYKMKTVFGVIKMITPTDCVKDRLAAFYHWNDRPSLNQAVSVARARKVNLKEIEKWSLKENNIDKFNEFIKTLKKGN